MAEDAARLSGHMLRGAALALAAVTFLGGLLAPLTPSEGDPRPLDVLLFVGVPVALTLWVALTARTRGWRLAGLGLAFLIAAVATWVFTAVL